MDEAATPARRDPVTAADLDRVVGLASSALMVTPPEAWARPAGGLTWDCWETGEHIADDLFAYAMQLASAGPASTSYLPLVCEPNREGGPASSIRVERSSGPEGLLAVIRAAGALLVYAVRSLPGSARAFHSRGVADPEGFAALGIVEVAVHAHDIATGLDVAWSAPSDVSARVLARLFDDVPDGDPWQVLLWACGRHDLPGRPTLSAWAPNPAAPPSAHNED